MNNIRLDIANNYILKAKDKIIKFDSKVMEAFEKQIINQNGPKNMDYNISIRCNT
ncbi:hypothetical protein JCM15060_15800 [Halanaerobaculum tunisiense]